MGAYAKSGETSGLKSLEEKALSTGSGPDGGYLVLAVALIECAEQGALRLGDTSGPELRLEPLPYGFETAV